jgi:hypothetical protein
MAKSPSRPSKPSAAADAGGKERVVVSGRASLTAMETARYIAEFSAELAAMARQSRLDALACLLEIARLEAVHTAGSADKR